jgi:hypothetical protein
MVLFQIPLTSATLARFQIHLDECHSTFNLLRTLAENKWSEAVQDSSLYVCHANRHQGVVLRVEVEHGGDGRLVQHSKLYPFSNLLSPAQALLIDTEESVRVDLHLLLTSRSLLLEEGIHDTYPPERQKRSRKVRQVTDGVSGVLHEAIADACTHIMMSLTQRYDAEEVLGSIWGSFVARWTNTCCALWTLLAYGEVDVDTDLQPDHDETDVYLEDLEDQANDADDSNGINGYYLGLHGLPILPTEVNASLQQNTSITTFGDKVIPECKSKREHQAEQGSEGGEWAGLRVA